MFLIWSVYFLAAATPGPSQFFILEKSLINSHVQARWGALGVSFGTVVWVLGVTWGLGAFMTKVPQARDALTVLSALLLYYFAARNLRAIWVDLKKTPTRSDPMSSQISKCGGQGTSSFVQGALVNLLNPNSFVFFVSLFAPLMAEGISGTEVVISAVGVGIISILWYQLIAEIWRFGKLFEFLREKSVILRGVVVVFYLFWATRLLI